MRGFAAWIGQIFNINKIAIMWAVQRSPPPPPPPPQKGIQMLRGVLLTEDNHIQWDWFIELVKEEALWVPT